MLSMQSIFLCFYASHTILLLIFDIDKRLWLTSLHQKVFYSDIVIRKSIRNERSMALLIRKLADSVMQPVAVKRLQNILQGDGTQISRNTISTYLSYLQEAFLFFAFRFPISPMRFHNVN